MQKYNIDSNMIIPQDKRANINSKILYIIANNLSDKTRITSEDVFNSIFIIEFKDVILY